jgi:hypothetical protein
MAARTGRERPPGTELGRPPDAAPGLPPSAERAGPPSPDRRSARTADRAAAPRGDAVRRPGAGCGGAPVRSRHAPPRRRREPGDVRGSTVVRGVSKWCRGVIAVSPSCRSDGSRPGRMTAASRAPPRRVTAVTTAAAAGCLGRGGGGAGERRRRRRSGAARSPRPRRPRSATGSLVGPLLRAFQGNLSRPQRGRPRPRWGPASGVRAGESAGPPGGFLSRPIAAPRRGGLGMTPVTVSRRGAGPDVRRPADRRHCHPEEAEGRPCREPERKRRVGGRVPSSCEGRSAPLLLRRRGARAGVWPTAARSCPTWW